MPVIIFISLFPWLSISCWRHLSRFTSMSFQISATRADFFKCKDVSFHRERQTNVGKSHLQKAESERVRGPIVSHDSPSAKPPAAFVMARYPPHEGQGVALGRFCADFSVTDLCVFTQCNLISWRKGLHQTSPSKEGTPVAHLRTYPRCYGLFAKRPRSLS